ncbi:MAG: hypothetical protein HYX53_04605 [Chloroflexi bacterium]|nr:hypothetical protein [Chloroflexota bacterium]
MTPEAPKVLNGMASALLVKLMPEVRTPFGQSVAGMAGMLAFVLAQESDRAVDRLHRENEAVAAILRDAAAILPDEALSDRAREAAGTRTPPDLRVSTMQAINDRLRAVFIEVHAAIEDTPGDDARALEERIWEEIRESTRRRHLEALM